jgi:hypothetical protein
MNSRVALVSSQVAEAGAVLHTHVFVYPPCPSHFQICHSCTPDGRPAPDMLADLRGAVALLSPEAHLRLRMLRWILRNEIGPFVLVVAPDHLLAWCLDVQTLDTRTLGVILSRRAARPPRPLARAPALPMASAAGSPAAAQQPACRP